MRPECFRIGRLPIALAACLLLGAAESSQPGSDANDAARPVLPKLGPIPAEVLSGCMPQGGRRTDFPAEMLVNVTISADGKASNLQFPDDIEPWQQATVACILDQVGFSPAMSDGVPVASEVAAPLVFRSAEHPVIVPASLDRQESEDLSDCYSRAARRAGAEGEVQIDLVVGTDGRVSHHELPPGIEPWQRSTVECLIPRLRFKPATRDDVPFSSKVSFPFSFSLVGSAPLTLARLAASETELSDAIRRCYPADRNELVTPHYRVTVNVRGWPSQVVLVKTSGDKELDKAGSCAIKLLRFEPAKRGEQPVMSTLLVPFELRPPAAQ